MADVHDIAFYKFEAGERLFYDTNVWAAINGLTSFTPDAAPYSAAHKAVLTVKALIFTDQTVLEEFANLQERETLSFARKTRLGQSNKLSPKEIKAFRRSNPVEWSEVTATVTDALRQITRHSKVLSLSEEALEKAVVSYGSGQIGFNDAVIACLCSLHDCALLTHDAEFDAFDVKIITAYSPLLSQN